MELLNDLSGELALAILVDKKYGENFKNDEAVNLIEKVREVLKPISSDKKLERTGSMIAKPH